MSRFWWPSVGVLAVFTYIYSLDGLHIPHIGDEAPYIQIVRLTAESGQWLPLKTASGLENTKPPLLFWLGIVSTDWARYWSLFRLRLPIVLITFLTAALVFLLADRMKGDRESGYIAALTFLGFASTFQYGRPFLTNLPETLFIFLPFFSLIYFRDRREEGRIGFWMVIGMSVGIACLFKSFVLVVPVGVALAWWLLLERGWHFETFLRKDASKIALALVLALGCFALWPFLDPDPGSVIRNFVLEENLGKLGGESYLSGLFTGSYPLHRIWLGHLANAGLFALPLLYLAVTSVKGRAKLSRDNKSLWILVLSFLIVYSVPSQRQENYLLPTVPALAVLMGVCWKEIESRWFYLFNVAIVLTLIPLAVLIFTVSDALPPGSYRWWQLGLPVVAILVTGVSLLWNRASPYVFHLQVFLVAATLAAGLAPFEGPLGRYDHQTVEALEAKTVYVPSNFISKYERHRFLLPGSRVEGYHPSNTERLNQLLRRGEVVALERGLGQTVAGPFEVYGKRLTLRSRQRGDEIARILFEGELDLLVQQEIIVRRRKQ
jgi:4-amino-4-deoxy-L-arabinose transferase-like glycosyltransferase